MLGEIMEVDKSVKRKIIRLASAPPKVRLHDWKEDSAVSRLKNTMVLSLRLCVWIFGPQLVGKAWVLHGTHKK